MINPNEFLFQREVAFHETDLMGVVHHSNYLKYFEEARVHWLRAIGLEAFHVPQGDLIIAVLATSCEHHRPLFFRDLLRVRLRIQLEGAKLRFFYQLYSQAFGEELVAEGMSLHIPVNRDRKVVRFPPVVLQTLRGLQSR